MTRLPYQRLHICYTTLIAARGSQIDTFNLIEGGVYLSTWKCPSPAAKEGSISAEKIDQKLPVEKSETDVAETVSESGPAAKRRKLSNGDVVTEEDTKLGEEPDSKNGKAMKKNSRSSPGTEAPNVVLLASTSDWQHVVAVTGEDKTIRVFKLTETGVLEQLSERVMPKRPCALQITADSSTIVCGDKFGDVYSLPLIPALAEPELEKPFNQDVVEVKSSTDKKEETPFVPAANHLTVHSQRNLKALENQIRQGKQAKEKNDPKFEHTLLLGHVSMLTDLALVLVEGKNYILTADRDEHIRLSRGIPQAHIIEGYCLGHTEFITRICKPKTANTPTLLISGGGDDYICSWDLPEGKLLQKVDLKSHVMEVMAGLGSQEEAFKLTVSGIHHVRIADDLYGQAFAVICEGVPAIFIYFFNSEEKTLTYTQTIRLNGNPLDLIAANWNCSIVVAIDTYFEAGSTTKVRTSSEDVQPLQRFTTPASNFWEKSDNLKDIDVKSNGEAVGEVKKEVLTGLLYGLGNLRKSGNEKEED